ncbi:trp RNA-binding attenuation protein MtrB [Bacillaceae bacterium]
MRRKFWGGKIQMEQDFIVILAKENGVNVIGLTRGQDTRFHHTEKLDKNEVMIAQFTEHTSAMKIRGKALIQTRHGIIDTSKDD